MSSKFPPVPSAPAKKTISEAFQDLKKTITPVDSRDFATTTLQHVQKAALEIETQMAARQSLRNMRRLMPLFRGLEHYAKVMDVLCNGTQYLSWIWAPITLILRIAFDYVDAFEVIMKGYSKIADSLVRFEVLEETFKSNHGFQQTLANYYSDILDFHKFAYVFVRRSSWKLLFLTSWGRFQRRFGSIMENLEHHGTLIDQEANARHIFESHQRWQEAQSWRKEQREKLERQENEQTIKQYGYIASWLNADTSGQDLLYDLAYSEGTKYSGTCNWVINNQKLRTWLRQDTESCICWLQGIPGAGKTVLVAQILAFMRTHSRTTISHFLNKAYESTTSYDQILRSLLLQLIRQDGDMAAYVYDKFVMAKKAPSTSSLEGLLQSLSTAISREPRGDRFLWILIDGFDSCESAKQSDLEKLLKQLVSGNPQSPETVCKVLIASRSSATRSRRLGRPLVISLTEEKDHLNKAIRQYASQRMDSMRYKFDQLYLSESDRECIKTTISNKADGMFLYARLILDYIGRNIFHTGAEVEKAVSDLPREISDFYQKLIAHILAPLDTQSCERVKSLFGWISYAKRPLKRLELLSAIAFSSADCLISHIVPEFVLWVCDTIVEERPDATLTFIHTTVNEFLQSTKLVPDQRDSVHEHGIASITCLRAGLHLFRSQTPDHAKNLRVVRGLHGFHLYANDHWIDYLLDIMAYSSQPVDEMPLYQLAVDLAVHASKNEERIALDNSQEGAVIDPRLCLIPDVQLRKLVGLCLESRSIKILEQRIFSLEVDGTFKRRDEIVHTSSLQAVTAAYQQTVRFLLKQTDYPETSSEELQRFRNHFSDSVFTCRLGKCPAATIGFDSKYARDEHELTHSKPFTCPILDCQYPAFVSKAAVQRHVNKFHPVKIDRKPIRRPHTWQPHGEATTNKPETLPQPDQTTQEMGLQEQQRPMQSANLKTEQEIPPYQMRRGNMTINNLPPQERGRLQQAAINRFNSTSEAEKNHYRQLAMQKLNPQQIHVLNSKGQDAALYYIQQTLVSQALQKMNAPQNGGMNPMQVQAQQQAQQQQAQQQQAQQRVNNLNRQQTRKATANNDLGPFSDIELMNQQKAGMMAQEAGQMVVPASISKRPA